MYGTEGYQRTALFELLVVEHSIFLANSQPNQGSDDTSDSADERVCQRTRYDDRANSRDLAECDPEGPETRLRLAPVQGGHEPEIVEPKLA
jgi:hypothetical protein